MRQVSTDADVIAQLDFGPADDSEATEVRLHPASAQSSASLALSAPRVVTPTQVRPGRLPRRRGNRPLGRAPRRACNTPTRGSRRVRAGPSSDDDPHEEEPDDDAVYVSAGGVLA